MGVASWSFDLVWAVDGSGPAGVLALAEGWVTVLSCTVVRGGWLPGVFGVGNTPAVVGCCGLVVVVVCWWWVPPRAFGAWGWHAVGVLGQCALVA